MCIVLCTVQHSTLYCDCASIQFSTVHLSTVYVYSILQEAICEFWKLKRPYSLNSYLFSSIEYSKLFAKFVRLLRNSNQPFFVSVHVTTITICSTLSTVRTTNSNELMTKLVLLIKGYVTLPSEDESFHGSPSCKCFMKVFNESISPWKQRIFHDFLWNFHAFLEQVTCTILQFFSHVFGIGILKDFHEKLSSFTCHCDSLLTFSPSYNDKLPHFNGEPNSLRGRPPRPSPAGYVPDSIE